MPGTNAMQPTKMQGTIAQVAVLVALTRAASSSIDTVTTERLTHSQGQREEDSYRNELHAGTACAPTL